MALVAVLGLVVMFFSPTWVHARDLRQPLIIVTSAGEYRFEVEVAESAQQKSYGLMFRTELGERTGMLFPYGSPQEITMWMRNTYIPLDMIFIRGDGIVHRIERRTEPLSERVIASEGAVTAVLEVAGGVAEKIGLMPGDLIRHKTFGTGP